MNSTFYKNAEHLLGTLYDAVLEPSGFQDFIEKSCDAFQLKAALMMIRHVDTQEMQGLWVHGIENGWLERYALEYAPDDLLAHHINASPIARFYASNLDIPHPERFPENRFYREWVVPSGVAYAAGGTILREGAWLTQLWVQRAPHHPPFSRKDMEQFNQLVPHLQRVIQMRQRFAELHLGQNFLASSLDVLAMPTLLFDEYSRVAHTNRSANALLSERSSMWLENSRLFTKDADATRSLHLELTNAIRASRGDGAELTDVVLIPRAGRMPIMLMIAPLRLTGSAQIQGAALLFVFDSETTPSITSDMVRQLFKLTDAEAELAAALCSGKTLDDAANERGTSVHTTRSQLKSIFNKTGTNRQTDLVSLLLASPAYFLAHNRAD